MFHKVKIKYNYISRTAISDIFKNVINVINVKTFNFVK